MVEANDNDRQSIWLPKRPSADKVWKTVLGHLPHPCTLCVHCILPLWDTGLVDAEKDAKMQSAS